MLINIQFLRFAAALMVVMYHACRHLRMTGADPGPLFSAAEATGFAGVDVFFVISGFIMFHTTTRFSGAGASVNFIKRRCARIYSGYWPFFLAAALVFAWARPDHFAGSNLTGSFFLWPMPLNKVLLDVSWTLSFEMYFYMLFTALVLLAVGRRLLLLTALVCLVGLYNLYRHFVLNEFGPDQYYYISFSNIFLTSPFLLEFFAGALLASFTGKGSRGAAWLILIAGIAGFAIAGAANMLVYDGNIEQGFHVVPRVLLFGIPSVLVLWGLVSLERNGLVAPRQFSLNTGGASYAIYLCHTIFLVATMKLGMNAALQGSGDLVVQSVFILYCALIVVFSVWHYRVVEQPLHNLFKRALGLEQRR